MKREKQLQVLELYRAKIYRCENDKVYKRKKGLWREVKPGILPTGYKQIIFTNDDGSKTVCYLHIAIYLYNNGEYNEWLEIDHLNRDNRNNMPTNLKAKPTSENRLNTIRPLKYKKFNTIREDQIKLIRQYLSEGANQSQIARKLGLERLATRYIIKQIECGAKLKYETIGKQAG